MSQSESLYRAMEPLSEHTQKELLLKLKYYPVECPVVSSYSELQALLERIEEYRLDGEQLKEELKEFFMCEDVEKEQLVKMVGEEYENLLNSNIDTLVENLINH